MERLQQAIRDRHGLDSEYVESVPITETFQGKTVWQGTVDVFRVRGHPEATHAYAWSYKTENGAIRHLAVLGVAPIDSPREAVRAAIAAPAREHLKARGE